MFPFNYYLQPNIMRFQALKHFLQGIFRSFLSLMSYFSFSLPDPLHPTRTHPLLYALIPQWILFIIYSRRLNRSPFKGALFRIFTADITAACKGVQSVIAEAGGSAARRHHAPWYLRMITNALHVASYLAATVIFVVVVATHLLISCVFCIFYLYTICLITCGFPNFILIDKCSLQLGLPTFVVKLILWELLLNGWILSCFIESLLFKTFMEDEIEKVLLTFKQYDEENSIGVSIKRDNTPYTEGHTANSSGTLRKRDL